MHIILDVGNSRIKIAVFEQKTQIELFVFEPKEAQKKIENILKKYPNTTHSVISSVGNLNTTVLSYLETHTTIRAINHETKFPFNNLYATPKTLGIDRMVVAAGAVLKYPNKNRLVIDAGTCITYDYIDKKDNYLGGAISPGITIRYKSLNDYTANLPLLEKKEVEYYIGNSTENSIHSGIINGICHEIEGFISQYSYKNQDLTLILTGGDADFLAKRLKSTIFANSNFLLESLNTLSIYLNKND